MAKHVDPAFAAGAFRAPSQDALGRTTATGIARLHSLPLVEERHAAPFIPVKPAPIVVTDADRKDELIRRGVSEALVCKASKIPDFLRLLLVMSYEPITPRRLRLLAAFRPFEADAIAALADMLADQWQVAARPFEPSIAFRTRYGMTSSIREDYVTAGTVEGKSCELPSDDRRGLPTPLAGPGVTNDEVSLGISGTCTLCDMGIPTSYEGIILKPRTVGPSIRTDQGKTALSAQALQAMQTAGREFREDEQYYDPMSGFFQRKYTPYPDEVRPSPRDTADEKSPKPKWLEFFKSDDSDEIK